MLHRSQVFLFLLLAFIVGIAAGSFFAIPQTAVYGALLVCVLVIVIFFRRGSKWLNRKLTFSAFLVLFCLFGILRFNLNHDSYHVLEKFAEANQQLNVAQKNHIKITLLGYIDGEPEQKKDKQWLRFRSLQAVSNNLTIRTDEHVLLIVPSRATYQYGQSLKVTAELIPPKNFTESDFDYISYLAKDDIFSLSYYPQITPITLKLSYWRTLQIGIYQKIFTVKRAFTTAINHSLAEPYAAYINGLLLGARTAIPDDIKRDFARTSTSHILAISGYNIALIAWVVSGFFLIWFRRPVAFWFALVGIFFFVIITGAEASVVRAALMGGVALLAQRQGRLYDVTNSLVLAAVGLILINPQILRYDIGFQLSFAGTLGLVYLSPHLEKYFSRWPTWLGRETLLLTVSAQLFVLPLLLYYFRSLSLVALPANLLVLPLIPYTMAVGFVVGLAGLTWPLLGQALGWLATLLAGYEIGVIHWLAQPSWAAITMQLPWSALLTSYLLIGLLLFYAVLKRRQKKATVNAS